QHGVRRWDAGEALPGRTRQAQPPGLDLRCGADAMAVDRGICAPGGRLVAGLALRAGLYLVVADPVRQEGSVPALLSEPVARYPAQRTAVDERPFPEAADGEAR